MQIIPSVNSETSSRPLSLSYEEIVRDFRNGEMQYLRHLNMILKVGTILHFFISVWLFVVSHAGVYNYREVIISVLFNCIGIHGSIL